MHLTQLEWDVRRLSGGSGLFEESLSIYYMVSLDSMACGLPTLSL